MPRGGHDCEARGCALSGHRKVKRRALYLLEDFSDPECRTVLERMIHLYPQQSAELIAEYWSEQIEGRK